MVWIVVDLTVVAKLFDFCWIKKNKNEFRLDCPEFIQSELSSMDGNGPEEVQHC